MIGVSDGDLTMRLRSRLIAVAALAANRRRLPMITRCQLLRLGALLCAVVVASCSASTALQQPGMVSQKLVDSVFAGEWKPGYVYQVSFRGTVGNLAATVHTADADNPRMTHDVPARVAVYGTNVELRYLQSDRVDKLIYIAQDDRLEGQSVGGAAAQERLWAKRACAGCATAAGGGDAATIAALFPEFAWAPVSSAISIGRAPNGVFGAICMSPGDGGQETLIASCGAALGQQMGLAPTSAGSLSWTGYQTFKTVGPNSGNLVVVVGRDNEATMDASVRVYKALEKQPAW